MGAFDGRILLSPLNDGTNWMVEESFSYVTTAGEKMIVPEGTVTDLASIPRVFWNILPPFGKYTGAAILHDCLYREQITDRFEADRILLEAMEAEGVSWLTRRTIYSAVRMFGGFVWKEHREDAIKRERKILPEVQND